MGSTLATSKLMEAGLHVGTQLLPRVVAFLQKSKRLADDFAGGLIETALNLLVHESFELWRKRDVHGDLPHAEAKWNNESCQYLS